MVGWRIKLDRRGGGEDWVFQHDNPPEDPRSHPHQEISTGHNKPNDPAWQKHTDRKFIKRDTFELMRVPGDAREHIKCTPQAWAGFILLRKILIWFLNP